MGKRIAVIGLGTFGAHLAGTLAAGGAEVLAMDRDAARLDDVRDRVALALRLDATDEKALRSQKLDDFDAVVLAIPDDFETTLLAYSVLQQMAVRRIVVAATTPVHERILDALGVKETILPDVEAAQRLGDSLLLESALGAFSVSSDYSIVEVPAPEPFLGKDLAFLRIPDAYGVSVVTVKRMRKQVGFFGLRQKTVVDILGIPKPGTTIERGDKLLVFGRRQDIEKMLKS